MESPQITSWEIPGSDGEPIYGNTHAPPGPEIKGAFIACHGFKGYKDYGFLPLLCHRAAAQGLAAFRFNFSHGGMTDLAEAFERPDLFEKDRWSRQLHDIGQVIDRLARPVMGHEETKAVLFGHSRGGVSSALFSGRVQLENIAALITAAAPDYACNLDETTREILRREGRLLSPSGRTGQDLYVGRDWLDEIERNPELYDPTLAAAQVKCPALIIHGSGDTTVPVECAHNLHRAAMPNSTLEIIDGASHTFNCPNPLPIDTPWEEVPEATRRLIDLTVGFAVEACKRAR